MAGREGSKRTTARLGACLVIGALAAFSLGGTADAAWQKVGGAVSPTHPFGKNARSPSVTTVNGAPYIAWDGASSTSNGNFGALWVARLAADGSWTRVPGPDEATNGVGVDSSSIAAAGGTPYVAYREVTGDMNVRVLRLNAAGTEWTGVGTALNHDINRTADNPSIATVAGVPFVAWREGDASPNDEIRVAHLNGAGTGWIETAAPPPSANSPINRNGVRDARQPSMADVGGVPYVAWSETDGSNFEIRAARLTAGDTWQRLEPPADNLTWGGINQSRNLDASDPSLTSIAGVPYVTWSESDGINTEIRVARLNASGAWEQVVGGASPVNRDPAANASKPTIVDFNGVPFVSWVEAGQVRVARLSADGNSWMRVADAAAPINQDAGKTADSPALANVGGAPFVAWQEPDATNVTLVRAALLEPDFQGQTVAPGATTASLSGTWRTYGVSFPIGFDYGASLESTSAVSASQAGEEVATVTQEVGGLAPQSVYQFRSFAQSPLTKVLAPNPTVFQTTSTSASDTTPPETTITKEPKAKSSKSKAKYKFTSSEPNSTFTCKFDKKKPKPCDSGKAKYKRLDDGKHKFKVYAVDAAGNRDPSPDKDKFKVR
jgi:hypothetical protein